MNTKTIILRAALLAGLLAAAAPAASISFTGLLTADNDIGPGQFNLPVDSNVRLVSLGASGGTNADGLVIGGGGFDAVLTLYTFGGTFLELSDDGVNVGVDALTGLQIDPEIEIFLPAGQYRFAVTQYDNYPVGDFVDGFLYDFDSNFTAFFGCPAGELCDFDGNDRLKRWAVDVHIEPVSAAVPEPSALGLLAAGLALALARRRRRA